MSKNKDLIKACRKNNIDDANKALQDSQDWNGYNVPPADVNCFDSDGNTPLMHAAKAGYRSIVQFLLQKGADPFVKNKGGENALMVAAAGGYKDIMTDLLAKKAAEVGKKSLILERNNAGQDALKYAASNGQSQAVIFLLDNGSLVDDRCNAGKTAAMHAAEKGDGVSLQILLDKKADINARDNNNRTPLMWAAAGNRANTAEDLLNRGARTDLKSNDGKAAQELSWHDPVIRLINDYIKKSATAKTPAPAAAPAPAPAAVPAPAEAKAAKPLSRKDTLKAALEQEGLDPAEEEHWVPIGKAAIDYIVASTDSPKLLSNVFNFASKQYVTTTKNLLTGEKNETSGSLDSFPNPELAVEAHKKLTALGKKPPPFEPKKKISL